MSNADALSPPWGSMSSFFRLLRGQAAPLIAIALVLPTTSEAQDFGVAEEDKLHLLTKEEFEDAVPIGQLSGRDIWTRFLDNRLHSAVQHQRVISTDPGGSVQTSRFWVRAKDYRDAENNPVDGVVTKTIIKFSAHYDMRHTGYLIVVNDDYSREQFVYQPSSRKVRRVNMVQSSFGGSDFSFDDLGFQNVDDADYERFPDEEVDGIPVYVVQATAKPNVASRYKVTLLYLEHEHYVPLKARYWDHANVEIRNMRAEPESLKEFNGIWVATASTMVNIQEGTSSQMFVEDLDPNVDLAEELFSTFRLTLDY